MSKKSKMTLQDLIEMWAIEERGNLVINKDRLSQSEIDGLIKKGWKQDSVSQYLVLMGGAKKEEVK